MQNSIVCPVFLQLGHILACGVREASRAIVGEDGEEFTLDVGLWVGMVGKAS